MALSSIGKGIRAVNKGALSVGKAATGNRFVAGRTVSRYCGTRGDENISTCCERLCYGSSIW